MKPASTHLAVTVLRWGIAFVFFFAAVATMLNPNAWAMYIPSFILSIVPVKVFLVVFGFFQIILAVWLFTGKRLRLSSAIACVTLIVIVIATLDSLDETFRDVGLTLAAFALFTLAGDADASQPEKSEPVENQP